MVKKLQTLISGYKTYIVGVVVAVLGVVNAIHIGKLDFQNISAFVAAGGLTTLRAGVKKVEVAVKKKA